MSTDIPTGEADLRPEVVDADRIRSGDRTRRQGGLDELVTAIEHTGRLVGFSRVVHDPTRPRSQTSGTPSCCAPTVATGSVG
ncbi:hypothetical protein G7085_18100 [Tessaracoccus sp. HDW20]|uniref:hypothetical protein n=1 Tax=Tessaracoccus coleopterorum TaxID=2714950 RepID=UPI0018D43538|nr:hypothetical protein [Tessaracoccus coleopterorum]